MILLGIGLGVISGSALKLLAPQVRQQQLALPDWLATQPWIESITPKDATQSNTESDSAGSTASLALLRNTGLPQHPFAPRQEIPALSQRWIQQAATQPYTETAKNERCCLAAPGRNRPSQRGHSG